MIRQRRRACERQELADRIDPNTADWQSWRRFPIWARNGPERSWRIGNAYEQTARPESLAFRSAERPDAHPWYRPATVANLSHI